MNAIKITTPQELLVMIIGVALFFIIGFAVSYMAYRLQNNQKA